MTTSSTLATEEDFQLELDAHPDDHHTRMVFADWLDEQGDPRAAGYRELGRLGRCPLASEMAFGPRIMTDLRESWWWTREGLGETSWLKSAHILPKLWFDCLAVRGKSDVYAPSYSIRTDKPALRRELEDAAALAYPIYAQFQTKES